MVRICIKTYFDLVVFLSVYKTVQTQTCLYSAKSINVCEDHYVTEERINLVHQITQPLSQSKACKCRVTFNSDYELTIQLTDVPGLRCESSIDITNTVDGTKQYINCGATRKIIDTYKHAVEITAHTSGLVMSSLFCLFLEVYGPSDTGMTVRCNSGSNVSDPTTPTSTFFTAPAQRTRTSYNASVIPTVSDSFSTATKTIFTPSSSLKLYTTSSQSSIENTSERIVVEKCEEVRGTGAIVAAAVLSVIVIILTIIILLLIRRIRRHVKKDDTIHHIERQSTRHVYDQLAMRTNTNYEDLQHKAPLEYENV